MDIKWQEKRNRTLYIILAISLIITMANTCYILVQALLCIAGKGKFPGDCMDERNGIMGKISCNALKKSTAPTISSTIAATTAVPATTSSTPAIDYSHEFDQMNSTLQKALNKIKKLNKELKERTDEISEIYKTANRTLNETKQLQIRIPSTCLHWLGVWSYSSVHDSQMSASSVIEEKFAAGNGRLFGKSAWIPDIGIYGQKWLEVDFRRSVQITGISTQGYRTTADKDEYVTKYMFQMFDENSGHWKYMTDPFGYTEIFNGNTDANSIITNHFTYSPIVKKVRVLPLEWASQPAMRIDVKGCYIYN